MHQFWQIGERKVAALVCRLSQTSHRNKNIGLGYVVLISVTALWLPPYKRPMRLPSSHQLPTAYPARIWEIIVPLQASTQSHIQTTQQVRGTCTCKRHMSQRWNSSLQKVQHIAAKPENKRALLGAAMTLQKAFESLFDGSHGFPGIGNMVASGDHGSLCRIATHVQPTHVQDNIMV